ncbi:MAG: hypothetical protein IH851_00950 [Armatimonadetes bacterium]|nr:hypothetical protein [Armatimonadota bacterium]
MNKRVLFSISIVWVVSLAGGWLDAAPAKETATLLQIEFPTGVTAGLRIDAVLTINVAQGEEAFEAISTTRLRGSFGVEAQSGDGRVREAIFTLDSAEGETRSRAPGEEETVTPFPELPTGQPIRLRYSDGGTRVIEPAELSAPVRSLLERLDPPDQGRDLLPAGSVDVGARWDVPVEAFRGAFEQRVKRLSQEGEEMSLDVLDGRVTGTFASLADGVAEVHVQGRIRVIISGVIEGQSVQIFLEGRIRQMTLNIDVERKRLLSRRLKIEYTNSISGVDELEGAESTMTIEASETYDWPSTR